MVTVFIEHTRVLRGIHLFIHSFTHSQVLLGSPHVTYEPSLTFPAPSAPVVFSAQLALLIHIPNVPLYKVPNLHDLPKLLLQLENERARGLGNQAPATCLALQKRLGWELTLFLG